MEKLIYSFEGNDLRHYAGVAKQYNLLYDKARHFLYDRGSLLYLKENGEHIIVSSKQEKWAGSLLKELSSYISIVNYCSLSHGKTPCSRCQKLKKISSL